RSHCRNTSLSIEACFPGDGFQTAFTRRVSGLVRRALDSQHPQVDVIGTSDHNAVARDAQVVMAVPVAWQRSRPDGVIVATSPASDSNCQLLDFLQEEARQLAEVLAANRDPSPTSDCWTPWWHDGTKHAALPCPPTRDAWVHELRVPLSAARFAL